MLQGIAQKKLQMRNAAWTIYCAELVLSRIAHWKHLEVNALRDSRIYTMQ